MYRGRLSLKDKPEPRKDQQRQYPEIDKDHLFGHGEVLCGEILIPELFYIATRSDR